jgi:hypothetical protein
MNEESRKFRKKLKAASAVPSGLVWTSQNPGVETPGYSQKSLRDCGIFGV